MAARTEDRYRVRKLLEGKDKKVTQNEGERLINLGITLVQMHQGYVISMLPYFEDILKLYKREVKESVAHAKPMLFMVDKGSPAIKLFHSIITKVLYLEKWGRPDILLVVQEVGESSWISTNNEGLDKSSRKQSI
jgi:hypothetical protein